MVKSFVRPYFLQPYKFIPFLSFNKQVWPSDITREYYLSFEDALWDLLPRLGYKKGSKLLVPSFYCIDVINNIRDHGYKVSFYEVTNSLGVELEVVEAAIKAEKPDIFVDFETDGVPSHISEKIERKLSFHSLIIHDRVHSLISSSVENYPMSDRHLILTSTRKVSPFPGSLALYTRHARRSTGRVPKGYTTKALLLWAYYVIILKIAVTFRITTLAVHAEKVLKKHDEFVGDVHISAPLPKPFLYLYDYLNTEKSVLSKKIHYDIYKERFHSLYSDPHKVWAMHDVELYSDKLRGYPLIIAEKYAETFVSACRNHGFLVVSQLDDSPWAKKQKLFLLPMGPHLSDKDITKIADIAVKALTRALQYDTITA